MARVRYMNLEIQKKSYAKNWLDWIQSLFTFKNILTTGVMERFLEKKWVKKECHSQIAPLENREWHSQIAPFDKKEWHSSFTP